MKSCETRVGSFFSVAAVGNILSRRPRIAPVVASKKRTNNSHKAPKRENKSHRKRAPDTHGVLPARPVPRTELFLGGGHVYFLNPFPSKDRRFGRRMVRAYYRATEIIFTVLSPGVWKTFRIKLFQPSCGVKYDTFCANCMDLYGLEILFTRWQPLAGIGQSNKNWRVIFRPTDFCKCILR